MRSITHNILVAAIITSRLAVAQPVVAQSSAPLTADEKREKSRLSKAGHVSVRREAVKRQFAYAEKCEAAFEAGDALPEPDFSIREEIGIDADLQDMAFDDIGKEWRRLDTPSKDALNAVSDCVAKFKKRDRGS